MLIVGQVVCFVAMLPGMLAEGVLMFFAPRAAKWAGDVLTWPAGWAFLMAEGALLGMRCEENRGRRRPGVPGD